ncbi:MAG TPA: L-lactate permease [Bryobacteraceae bacterium]|nr:L-lactate permease [Bryobacteraceae bacterium]
MWQQNYTPIGNSLPLSALVAALPIFVLLYLIGVRRLPAWKSALAGLITALLVAFFGYGMPVNLVGSAAIYGAAFGLWPIGWVVFSAVLLYRVTLESGKFEVLKDSIAHLADDRRLQVLLIAFAFGAFVEGAAGFGTPVAVAGSMLAGLGFSPFYAAAICLLANTAPVAFGSIAIPIVTLAGTTGLPLDRLSAGVGRMCTPLTVLIPAYLILVMSGWKALRSVLPAAATCGLVFAAVMYLVSNFVGPQLTDILASLAAIGALVVLLQFWKPKDVAQSVRRRLPHSGGQIFLAWGPYILLVICVLVWGYAPVAKWLGGKNIVFAWPGLHNVVQRVQPVVNRPTPYAATFNFSWLSAAGTSVLLAAILGSFVAGMSPVRFAKTVGHTAKQLALAELTLACVLGLAYVMNYSGATATLGLAFVATGVTFPFFSAWLGWLGVFLTGSDTSANALFGSLQVVTATKLGMNQVLMAAVNSAGGVTGKMISLTSIAVASAATSMKREDETVLFRFTLKHSLILTSAMGALALFFAYVVPSWAP